MKENEAPTGLTNRIFISKLEQNKNFRLQVQTALLGFYARFNTQLNPSHPMPIKAYKEGIEDTYKHYNK